MLKKERVDELIRVSMEEAEAAIQRGDDPFGGVIADRNGTIVVRNGNRQNTEMNAAAHAEMVLIREACKKLGTTDLSGYISVCNAESCPMCASALVMSGIREFYFGTHMEDSCNPYIRMQDVLSRSTGTFFVQDGILEPECTEIMQRGRRIRAEEKLPAGSGEPAKTVLR